MTQRSSSILVAVLAAASVASGCSSVLGATCAAGYVICAGRCVDLSADETSCGACGAVCGSGTTCVDGHCGIVPDGGIADADVGPTLDAGDGGGLDGGGLDGGDLDAGDLDAGDAGELDGGELDGGDLDGGDLDGGELDGGDLDAPGLDAPVPDAGPPCTPPEVACAGLCVDLETDPEHCGACGVVCPSGLCVARACMGGPVGHVVVLGHDYETSRIAMRRVVGNAIFLARTSPVAVVAYVGDATAASRTGTDAAIDATATALGRTWVRTVAPSSASVPSMLASADVLLIYAQRGATDASLAAIGSSWSSALGTFVDGGGIVVVLDTASPTNAGTFQLLAPAGFFSATGVTDVSLRTMRVVAPGDAVALGVPLSYRGERTSVSFGSTDGVVVITDPGGAPVVVHHTSGP